MDSAPLINHKQIKLMLMTIRLCSARVVFCIWPVFPGYPKIKQPMGCWHLQAQIYLSGRFRPFHITGTGPDEPAECYAKHEQTNIYNATHKNNFTPFPTMLARSRRSLEKSGAFLLSVITNHSIHAGKTPA